MSVATTDGVGADGLSREELYGLLANRRRRYVIDYLSAHDGPVALGTLAEGLAAWEHDCTPPQVTSAQRKVAYTALQQHHLPKLARAGLVQFDRRQGLLTPAPHLEAVTAAAGLAPRANIPWHGVYLALALAMAVVLAGVWLGVASFAWLPALAWAGVFVGSVAVTALAHTVTARRNGARRQFDPPDAW